MTSQVHYIARQEIATVALWLLSAVREDHGRPLPVVRSIEEGLKIVCSYTQIVQ